LYCIRQVKNRLPKSALKTLYYALIHSQLTYCPIILSCLNTKNKNCITKIQKKVIRIITKSNYNEHTGPLFNELKILTYDKIITQAKLQFMHAIEYSYAPESFSNIWTKNERRGIGYELRNQNEYIIPNHLIELFKRIPLFSYLLKGTLPVLLFFTKIKYFSTIY
jgi:hypothetical protein